MDKGRDYPYHDFTLTFFCILGYLKAQNLYLKQFIKMNILKKILLFLNASSYRLSSGGNPKDTFYSSYDGFSYVLVWCLEFSLFRLTFKTAENVPWISFSVLIAMPFIIQLVISLLFSKDLQLIKKDYYSYYNKYLYWVYCVLTIAAVCFALYDNTGWAQNTST
jgi:hypothetical protein